MDANAPRFGFGHGVLGECNPVWAWAHRQRPVCRSPQPQLDVSASVYQPKDCENHRYAGR
jgi:hypothetical protein